MTAAVWFFRRSIRPQLEEHIDQQVDEAPVAADAVPLSLALEVGVVDLLGDDPLDDLLDDGFDEDDFEGDDYDAQLEEFEGEFGFADEAEDDPFSSAYEGMTFEDSADDGMDAPVFDPDDGDETDYELEEEAERLMSEMPTHLVPVVQFALATGCRKCSPSPTIPRSRRCGLRLLMSQTCPATRRLSYAAWRQAVKISGGNRPFACAVVFFFKSFLCFFPFIAARTIVLLF